MTCSCASPELRLNAAGGKTFRRRNLRGKVGVKREAPISAESSVMDAIIYLVGLVVVILAILSFFGLH